MYLDEDSAYMNGLDIELLANVDSVIASEILPLIYTIIQA